MNEYTKGEWKANKNWMGTYTIHTDDAHIADVDRHFNAQLIASAPDLYEALKYAYEWRWKQTMECGDIYDEVGLKLISALAKAEGK